MSYYRRAKGAMPICQSLQLVMTRIPRPGLYWALPEFSRGHLLGLDELAMVRIPSHPAFLNASIASS
jgi:hypothetical protein